MQILIIDQFADIYKRQLGPQFPGVDFHLAPAPDKIPVDLATIDAMVLFGVAVNDGMLVAAKNLKWIQSLATGVDHFLRCPSLRRETILTSARGIHGPAMSESAAYLMMTLQHETPRLVRAQDARKWDRSKPWTLLRGKTAVVVGIGVGGIAIGKLLQAFGMHVIGVTRTPRQLDGFDEMMPTSKLSEAAARADYLIGILPGSPENLGLFNAEIFAAMKPKAFFVNLGRGETVDDAALIAALSGNKIAGAGLDVFREEPLSSGSPFWDLPNVVICPHIGGFFSEYEDYVIPLIAENLQLFLGGKAAEMKNIVPH
jgi:D-2-hydroxyacid dehydrogenase (NADP+)